MKKLTALFVVLCMLLAAYPAMADYEYLGDMEVINCDEWVSLRESPSVNARRLLKIPLGDVVRDCEQFSDEWVYGEYNGYCGYILAEYLQSCEAQHTISAMMVTIVPDGAPFYSMIDSTEPIDVVPTNTIVRNCRIMSNGRIYVEWGCRSGYIPLLHAEVYNEMLHFPRQITLYETLNTDKYDSTYPALKIAYLSDFNILNYDHNCYEYDDFMEADSPDLPKVSFVLYSDTTVSNVHLFSVSGYYDGKTDAMAYEAVLEDIQYQLGPEHPLSVGAVIWGDMPNLAVGYEDDAGVYHFAFIEISGEDGSLILREF